MKSHMSIIVLMGLACAGLLAFCILMSIDNSAGQQVQERARVAIEISRKFGFEKAVSDASAPPSELWFAYEVKDVGAVADYERDVASRQLLEQAKQEEAADPE